MPPPTPRAGTLLVSIVSLALSVACATGPATDRTGTSGSGYSTVLAPPPADPGAIGAQATGIDRSPMLHRAFERARTLVGYRRGLDLDALALDIVDDATIDVQVRLETERLVTRQFHDPRYAQHFVERVMHGQSGTYAALYVARQDRVLVSLRALNAFLDGLDDAALQADALLALMIHEVVHAADDREYDIDAVRTLDFRAAFAQSAVYEGHAQWTTRQVCARNDCLDGLDALDRFMFGDPVPADPLVPSGGSLSRNVLEYAYVEGERFVAALAERDGGERALQRLLAQPPIDPIQILDPDGWPNGGRDRRNRDLLGGAARAAHPWTRGEGASPARSVVAASPLKGVNLRSDPERRRAAIDGFTRLLVSMVALELHDERDTGAIPVAMTMLQAESASTAALFADTLHANNRRQADTGQVSGATGDGIRLSRTATGSAASGGPTRTLVAVHGDVVLQLVAVGETRAMLDDYARAVFAALDTAAAPVGAGLVGPGPVSSTSTAG